MANKDQFVAEISFQADRMEAGIRKASTVLEKFDTVSTKTFENFAKAAEENMKRAGDQAAREARELQKFAEQQAKSLDALQKKMQQQGDIDLAGGFDDIGSRGQALLGSFLDASSQVEQFRLTLTTLTGSAEKADVELAKLQKYANLTPFDLQNVVGAGVQLRTLSVDVDRFLPLAGDLASVFNRDIGDSAQALGKALSGSQDGIQVLNDSFGITKRELKEAGASIGNAGEIALNTKDDLRKLADAIEKVAEKKNFVGAVNQQLGTLKANASQASDAAFNLSAAIGSALAPAFIPLAQAATNTLNTLTSLPKPILSIIGGTTALAAGIALAGGAFLTLNAVLGSVVGIATKIIPMLTGIQVASAGAASGATAAAVAFNPWAAGLTAVTLVLGGAMLALNSFEQSAKSVGDQVRIQSQEVGAANAGFLEMRRAISVATGASEEFVSKGESVASTLEKVRGALEKTSSSDFLAAIQKGGASFDDLGAKAKEASDKLEALGKRKAVLEEFVKADGKLLLLKDAAQIKEVASALRREFGTADVAVSEVQKKIEHLGRTMAGIQQTRDGLIAPAIAKATPAFVGLTDAATRAQKVVSDFKINGDTDSLKRNNQLLAEASKQITTIKSQIVQASSGKIDVGNINALQDRLTSGQGSKEEKAAIEGLLKAIDVRNKLLKQGNDLSEKGVKARVDAALEDARALETSKERIVALQEALKIEGLSAQQRKAINAEISREQKAITAEQKAASKELIQQAIFEAQSVEGGAQAKINAIQRVLDTYKLESSTRRQLLKDIDKLEDEISKERTKRVKEETDALAAESQRQQELMIAALDERIAKLQEEAAAGKNVQAELTASLEERTAKEIALLEEKTKARAAEAKSSKVADEIEKTGALEVDAARRAGIDSINEQKKAQDERIKKIREERKEALKAAKDEKAARREVLTDSVSSSSTSTQQTPAQQPQQGAQAPGISLEQVAAQLASSFSVEAGRARAEEIRAGRADKVAEDRARFEEANPEVFARVLEEDNRRKEALAKSDEDRQKKAAETMAQRFKENEAKQAAAQAQVFASRQVDASNRIPAIEKRKLMVEDFFAFQAAGRAKIVAEPKAVAPSNSPSGTITVELEIKNASVTAAKVKGKSADLDGRVTDIARIGDKASFKVRT